MSDSAWLWHAARWIGWTLLAAAILIGLGGNLLDWLDRRRIQRQQKKPLTWEDPDGTRFPDQDG